MGELIIIGTAVIAAVIVAVAIHKSEETICCKCGKKIADGSKFPYDYSFRSAGLNRGLEYYHQECPKEGS